HAKTGPFGLEAEVAGDIAETLAAFVAIESVHQGLEMLGAARIALDAEDISLAGRILAEGPVRVMADVEVREAVAVDVGPAGAGAPGVVARPELVGDVRDAPAAVAVGFIVKQGQASVAGDQQIGPAVAIVVGDGGAVGVPPAHAAEPDLVGDIAKLPVA